MRMTVPLLAIALHSATPAAAQDATAIEAQFLEAVKQNNCTMTEQGFEQTFGALGWGQVEFKIVEALVERLADTPDATLENDTFSLGPALCAPAAEAGTPAPQSLSGREREFVRLITKNGCRISQSVAARLMPIYGFETAEVEAKATDLIARGLARVEGDELVLTDAVCPGRPGAEAAAQPAPVPAPAAKVSTDVADGRAATDPPVAEATQTDVTDAPAMAEEAPAALADGTPTDAPPAGEATATAHAAGDDTRAVLVGAIRDHGCRLSSTKAQEILPDYGLTWGQAREVAALMVAEGAVRPEGDDIVLSPELCGDAAPATATAAPEPAAPAIPVPDPDSRFGKMIEIIRANACQLSDQQADDIFDPLGYSYDELNGYLDQLVEAGRASFDGEMVRLSPAFCLGITSLAPPSPTKHATTAAPRALPRPA